MDSALLLKHMDQLNLVPENNQTRPKMANYVLLSFGSDGGLNQPNGTEREQIIFNGKIRVALTWTFAQWSVISCV